MEPQTKIIFLHGNPGSPNDFDSLINQLNCDRKTILLPNFMLFDNPVEETISYVNTQLNNKTSNLVIIAYSYGAYLACKMMENESFAQKHSIKSLIFISPYVLPQNKLSFFAKLIMSIPILKNIIAKKIAIAKYNGFKKEILGDFENATKIISGLSEFLLKPETWIQALNLKRYQEKNEVNGKFNIPNISFFSKDDQVMDISAQADFIHRMFSNPVFEYLPTGNHGLIWTKTDSLAISLRNKI